LWWWMDMQRGAYEQAEAAQGLTLRRSMIVDGVAPQATGDYTTQESQAAFTNGDVVFMRNWPFVYGLLSDPETSRVKPDQVDIAPLPVAEETDRSFSGLGGWNFMVNATSEGKLEEIWTFIEYMSAPEQQRTFALEYLLRERAPEHSRPGLGQAFQNVKSMCYAAGRIKTGRAEGLDLTLGLPLRP
jgi:multiple sugar transport system substrate-binding protein